MDGLIRPGRRRCSPPLFQAWKSNDTRARALVVHIRKCHIDLSSITVTWSPWDSTDRVAVDECLRFLIIALPNLSALKVSQSEMRGKELLPTLLARLVHTKKLTSLAIHSSDEDSKDRAIALARAIYKSKTLQHVDISESAFPSTFFEYEPPQGVECKFRTLRVKGMQLERSPDMAPRILTMHHLRELYVHFSRIDILVFEPSHLPHLGRLTCPWQWLRSTVPSLCPPSFRHLGICFTGDVEMPEEEFRAAFEKGPGHRGRHLLSLDLHPTSAWALVAGDFPLIQELTMTTDLDSLEYMIMFGTPFEHGNLAMWLWSSDRVGP